MTKKKYKGKSQIDLNNEEIKEQKEQISDLNETNELQAEKINYLQKENIYLVKKYSKLYERIKK